MFVTISILILKTSRSHLRTKLRTFDIKKSFLFILKLTGAASIKKNKLQHSRPVHASYICACT
ncbi:hypothetical protein BGAPBR_Q0062 (plasmid) [Borreliella garinii PBr]|uniref:Uncharacterized protein n=1 Tax=Borreliella garinii PBr TaxID=498743 RepID=B8F1E0_BORGR|nr:hypothetical protein BGAPBR_Q0062 [Borreliella garinii PBr]